MADGLPAPLLRFALVTATVCAVIVLAGILPEVVRYACVGAIVAVAALTITERRREGGGWWLLLGAGALLSAVGAGLAELSDTVGGLIAITGGALVVIACTIGYPVDRPRSTS